MLYYFVIFISLIENSRNDWVEIPQFSSKKTYFTSSKYSNYEETSTENFANIMQPSATTPTSLLMENEKVIQTTESVESSEEEDDVTIDDQNYAQSDNKKFQDETNSKLPLEKREKAVKDNGSEQYSGFMSLLNSIQQTLTKNARKSFNTKLVFLQNLRDTLLNNIDERISSLWKAPNSAEARGHDDHEMDFPSNEGALMTIGFLTFAVFLIKLILKLIHALKNKQQPAMMNTMAGTATTYFGRRKREAMDDNLIKILQYIEEYQIK